MAIKIHAGEYNRTACLRSEFVTAIVEEVKACGGRPFVADTTTLTYHLYNNPLYGSDGPRGRQPPWLELGQPGCAFYHCRWILRGRRSSHRTARRQYPERNPISAAASTKPTRSSIWPMPKGIPSPLLAAAPRISASAPNPNAVSTRPICLSGAIRGCHRLSKVNREACQGTECPYHKMCEDSCPEKPSPSTRWRRDGL